MQFMSKKLEKITENSKKEINNNIQIDGYIPSSYAGVDGNKIDLYNNYIHVRNDEHAPLNSSLL